MERGQGQFQMSHRLLTASVPKAVSEAARKPWSWTGPRSQLSNKPNKAQESSWSFTKSFPGHFSSGKEHGTLVIQRSCRICELSSLPVQGTCLCWWPRTLLGMERFLLLKHHSLYLRWLRSREKSIRGSSVAHTNSKIEKMMLTYRQKWQSATLLILLIC